MSETEPIGSQETNNDLTAAAASQLEPLNALVDATFSEMSRSIEEQLLRLSTDSRLVMRDMVDGILEDLASLAAEELIRNPLESALGTGVQTGAGRDGDALGEVIRRGLRNG
ncbi:MAG: hypothetical protein AAGA39_10520 [Pseudomonadota bacterium]